jgi:peptidoglycan/xylan/chitin deacetylase (PgdA/CDA1 family)
MYHRIADPHSDVWKIAVSPDNFEQQVQLLQKKAAVIPLQDLVEAVAQKTVKKSYVALTFDDGYVDNFLVAKPILDHYNLPATFFIASGNIDKSVEFWWDELESVILFSEVLPSTFSATIAGEAFQVALEDERYLSSPLRLRQQLWNANTQTPPTRRSALFLQLYHQLQPLSYQEQQLHLQHIKHWAGIVADTRPAYRSMSSAQLRSLSASQLHDIGVHTVHHPALAFHPQAYQRQELVENRAFLEAISTKKVDLLAYPYGNYNHESVTVAADIGFRAAFTTEAKAITNLANRYQLGRFQVTNMPGPAFARQLYQWQRSY